MKVAILSGGANHFAGADYGKGWEVWGINSVHLSRSARWARMFNLHRLVHLERDCPQYVDWDATWSRRNPGIPLYVVDSWKGLLTNQVIFQRKALAKQPRTASHASSFDWLVAYAVHLKAKEIHIRGAHFALDSNREEPISAQACLEYWCGYATGRGIKVVPGPDCEMFQQYHLVASHSVYGYDDVHMVEDRT